MTLSTTHRPITSILLLLLATPIALPSLAQDTPLARQNPLAGKSQSELIEVLRSEEDAFTKAKACQQLAVVGDEGCTEALIDLLGNEELGVYALTALQRIPGDRINAALVYALQAHTGRTRVGIIHTIQQRKIDSAVDQLVRLLRSDTATAEEKTAATRALGSLGSVDMIAVKANDSQLQKRVARDAILRAKQKRDTDSVAEDDRQRLRSRIESFDSLSPAEKIIALNVLSDFGPSVVTADDQVSESIVESVGASDVDLASAAVGLLARWGHYENAARLPDWVNDRPELAKTSLPMLALAENPSLDREVIKRLAAENADDEQSIRLGLIGYAAERHLSDATPSLLRLAGDGDSEIAEQALQAAGYTASIDQFSSLLDTILSADDFAADDVSVTTCMSRVCVRLPRDDAAAVLEQKIAGADNDQKIWLLSALSELGGPAALRTVVRAAESGDEVLVDGATRALGQWLSADVAEPLLRLTHSLPPGNFRTRALRAYLRVGRQFDIPIDERLEICRQGLSLAQRNDERVLVVDILRRNPSPEAARMLLQISSSSEDRSLKHRALSALAAVAEKVAASHPEEFRSIINQLDLESAPAVIRQQLQSAVSGT